jgi:diadenosine tetraphosphate (Ap4A) HIT family hydrolase
VNSDGTKKIGFISEPDAVFGERLKLTRSGLQVQGMLQDRAIGRCCFCTPDDDEVVIYPGTYWRVVENKYPYKGTVHHLLIIPVRHFTAIHEASSSELQELHDIYQELATLYPSDAYSITYRNGKNNVVAGATQPHLHIHYTLPNGKQDIQFRIGACVSEPVQPK